MKDLVIIESNLRELSAVAESALALLSDSDGVSDSVRYQRLIRCVSELRQLWSDHLALESQVPQFSDLFTDLADQRCRLEHELNALGSAAWPRSPRAGLSSIQRRISEVLTALLYQIGKERILIAALKHEPSLKTDPETKTAPARV